MDAGRIKTVLILFLIFLCMPLIRSVSGESVVSDLLYTLQDPNAGRSGAFGFALATVGDVNGDSIPDIAVGAFNKNVGGNDAQGQAFAFSGADGSLLYILNNPVPQRNAQFGSSITGVEDVNDDAIPDLAVGAPTQRNQGQVFVFSGVDGALLYTLNSANPNPQSSEFGVSLAGIGDVDGDSVPDIAVGARAQEVGPGQPQGQAFVFSGANGSLLYTLDNPHLDLGTAQLFGDNLAGVGDVNGDAIPDLAVGAWQQRVGGIVPGQAFVFSGVDGALLYTLDNPNPQDGANFGRALAGVGDINKDSVPDIVVGAPGQNVNNRGRQGQAFVFSGANGSLVYSIDNPHPQAAASFGTSLKGIEDIDGDAISDIVVGAPNQQVNNRASQGQAFVFSGVNGSLLAILNDPVPQADALFGRVVGVGDINGDSVPDVAVGAPIQDLDSIEDAGQVFVFSLTRTPRPKRIEVEIDIKPGSARNPINPRSKGVIPVAILTTDTFDATTVDPLSVEFGPGKATEAHGRGHIEDANRDGKPDLILHFRTQKTGIRCGQTSAGLTGVTEAGREIEGEDAIVTVGCQKEDG